MLDASPPIPCLCGCLRRASRAVTRLYDKHLAPTGLKTTQYSLLRVLAEAGALTQRQVADVLLADPTTLSRTLAPLERAGLLTCEVGEDRRERSWSISPAGRRKLAAAERAWRAAQDEMRDRLGMAEFERFRSALLRLGSVAA